MKHWYNFNDILIDFIIPRLKEFKRKNVNSYPATYKNSEDWHKDIDEMLYCLKEIRTEKHLKWILNKRTDNKITQEEFKKLYEERAVRLTKGLELFGRSIPDFWD